MNRSSKESYLVLENPAQPKNPFLFEGLLSGKDIRAPFHGDKGYGEIVFNTSMTGYQEVLTDPSYFGQIVCMTYPHIGNTGINDDDIESRKLFLSGFVTHQICEQPSNWRSKKSLSQYLFENDIPYMTGVSVRALTRALRSQGVGRGFFIVKDRAHEIDSLLAALPSFEGRDMIGAVSSEKTVEWKIKQPQFHIIALDFGIKSNMIKTLNNLGCSVTVVPAQTSEKQIRDLLDKDIPNGLFLSNGPGDPSAALYAVETVRSFLGQIPIFGVCMGQQILALALGAKTYKMKFGHRGSNQPVMDLSTRKVEISSHNHGYAVDPKSLPSSCVPTHINLNDGSLEGFASPSLKAFSVQYHPEAAPGPSDSIHIFKKFLTTLTL